MTEAEFKRLHDLDIYEKLANIIAVQMCFEFELPDQDREYIYNEIVNFCNV